MVVGLGFIQGGQSSWVCMVGSQRLFKLRNSISCDHMYTRMIHDR
jgi:hypothetical protein